MIALVKQLLVMHIGFVLDQSHSRIRELRARLYQLQLVRLGIDFGDELTFFYGGIEVRVDGYDWAGHVASDLDSDHGIQRTGGGNGTNYSSLSHFGDYV